MGFKVRTRSEPHSAHYQLVNGNDDPVTAVSQFLDALRVRGLSSCTIRAYAFDFVLLYRWLEQTGRELRRLQEADLLEFVDAQRKKDAQPTSINRRLTTCRLLYRFCTGNELPSGPGFSGPAPHYRGRGKDRALGLHQLRRARRLMLRVKTPRRVVEPLTRDEVRAFLRSLRRYRDIAIVHLMLLCGFRSREILDLNVSDICFEERRIRVHGKGNKERVLPLPEILIHSLSDYLKLEREPTRTVSDTPLERTWRGPACGSPFCRE
jgi:site-specific recombinase XerD